MSDSDSLFQPACDHTDEASMVAGAIACVEAFTERFNARDLAGMDDLLHFPHVILSGEELTTWSAPGQLPASFFNDVTASTGWHRTSYQEKRVALVSSRKVHLVVDYSRDDVDGKMITQHRNLWIVTFDGGRWGIKARSY